VTKYVRLVIALVVVLTAWTVGNLHGQSQLADFEIHIVAPEGKTLLYCAKGCGWKEDSFFCHGGVSKTCGSAYNQNGFLQR
jgi:hypothetical protein